MVIGKAGKEENLEENEKNWKDEITKDNIDETKVKL